MRLPIRAAALPAAFSLLLLATGARAQGLPRATGAPERVTGTDDGPYSHPRFSPDGSRLAFTSEGFAGLWVHDLDSGRSRRVTDAASAGFGFAWSPDGSALLARTVRQADGRRTQSVRLYDATTAAETEVVAPRSTFAALPVFVPGGTEVALPTDQTVASFRTPLPPTAAKAGRPDRFLVLDDARLMLADATTGAMRRLDVFEGQALINLAASPDGRAAAFEVVGGNVHIVSLDDLEATPVDVGPGNRPQWSPDGSWLVLMRTEDDGERFTASDLWAVRADGSAEVRLTDTADRLEMNPSWSPDGTRIAYDDLVDGVIYLLPVAR